MRLRLRPFANVLSRINTEKALLFRRNYKAPFQGPYYLDPRIARLFCWYRGWEPFVVELNSGVIYINNPMPVSLNFLRIYSSTIYWENV